MRLPGLDETEQRSWQQFVESSIGLLTALNRSLTDQHMLDLSELRVLEFLAKSVTGSARMSELAEALTLRRSRVTWLTRRLEGQGLLRRGPIPGDGRGVGAQITTAGRLKVRDAYRTYANQIRKLYVNQMSRQQMLALGASCQKINSSLLQNEIRQRSASSPDEME